MPRGLIIALGTFLWGVALYFGSVKLPGLVRREPWMTIVFVASFIIVGVAMALVNRWKSPPVKYLSVEEMEELGLLTHEQYKAVRAFQMDEFEDEGVQYFIELKNGAVLSLCGQHLYDYEPMDATRQANRTRKVPCARFSILRHTENGWIMDVQRGGAVPEPECEEPPFGEAEPSADAHGITGRRFDYIKQGMTMSRKA